MKQYQRDGIVAKLSQVEVLMSRCENIADAFSQIGRSEVVADHARQHRSGV
jgi:hypothetical protein